MKLFLILSVALAAQDGAALYKRHCAGCHDSAAERVPPLSALQAMSVSAIRASLESGKMRQQAAALSAVERDSVAAFLGKSGGVTTPIAYCKDVPAAKSLSDWNGWSPGLTNSRFQSNPGWEPDQIPRLKLKWAFALGQGVMARGQPAVVDGRLYIGTQSGLVYALHPGTGCVHWAFQAAAHIRSGLASAGGRLFFGDGKANVYAVDAATGKQIWTVRADEHPSALVTGTVQPYDGVVYVPVASFEEATGGQPTYPCCTFRGSLLALDALTGKQLWKTYTIAEPPRPTRKNNAGTQLHGPSGAGVWSTPTIDTKTGRIFIATGDNYSDPPTATSVDLANGRRALVVGQKSGVAHAIDPDAEGRILWQTRAGEGGMLGGIQWGSAADAANMYVAVADTVFQGRRPDSSKGGGVFALQLATGEKIWSAPPAVCPENKPGCSPGHSAAVTVMPGAVFAGSLDGHLRAFSTAGGRVIWDFDTAREFDTTNGGKASGGSIDGPGPVAAGGMLFTNSGYGMWGGMPGNVLLAFSIDGR